MPKYGILKALEHSKLSAATRKKYPNEQALHDAGWWLQKKYDGVFGMAYIRPDGMHSMQSRTGELISSCDHILQALYEAAQAQSGGWDGFVVLGELWHETKDFPVISGDVRRRSASPHLVFVMNDILPPELVTGRAYGSRLEDLEDLHEYHTGDVLHVVSNADPGLDVWVRARQWVADGGYDGAILRDPAAGYTIGSASAGQIVKVKPTLSLALRVKDLEVGAGEKTGRAVYCVVVEYRGVHTVVGAGMPHAGADCPAEGQIVEVECLGITRDGKLREPRYKGIRHDVLEPDT